MQRLVHDPRPDWRDEVERELGFTFHTVGGEPYWDETAHWSFTAAEIDSLEEAGNELHQMCLAACQRIVERRLFGLLGLPPMVAEVVEWSWDRFRSGRGDEMPIYGRFDLVWDGTGDPRCLEYNASTPTSLYESSVVQWHWLQGFAPHADQFNALHERLIERWRRQASIVGERPVHFAAADTPEDMGTASYMQSLAIEAGLGTKLIPIGNIAFDAADRCFYDTDGVPIEALWSLYPPEWMLQDDGATGLLDAITGERLLLMEPIWKLMLTKAVLPVLWDMYPHHPYLLRTTTKPTDFPAGSKIVAKPLWGREGDGVSIATIDARGMPVGTVVESKHRFAGDEGWVYQEYVPLPHTKEGGYALCGVWMVGDQACGLGMREDRSEITGNASRFVPHLFVPD